MPEAIIYPLSTLTFSHFLTDSGFSEQGKSDGFTVWTDGENTVSVPGKNELTQAETETLVKAAGLTVKFMLYMKSIQPSKEFNDMVKMSLFTPPVRKRK